MTAIPAHDSCCKPSLVLHVVEGILRRMKDIPMLIVAVSTAEHAYSVNQDILSLIIMPVSERIAYQCCDDGAIVQSHTSGVDPRSYTGTDKDRCYQNHDQCCDVEDVSSIWHPWRALAIVDHD